MKKKIKIAIAEDLEFFRSIFSDIFSDEKEFEILGIYKNAKELLDNLNQINPDIILSDFNMGTDSALNLLDGLNEKKIFIPVIIISSYVKQESEKILSCLAKGAIDIIEKPTEQSFKASFDLLKNSLLKKVRYIYNNTSKIKDINYENNTKVDYILIGASTGGTKAIELIISSLKKFNKTTIFISQHMPPKYTKTFASRLNEIGKNPVKEACDGEKIEKGTIYIAPGGANMTILDNKIKLYDAKDYIVSPNIDVMFESFVPYANKSCGILLTGMGNDGAIGLKKLHDENSITVIQDERTSVVYGMPKAAAELFIVDYVLPIYLIPHFINSISI